MAKFYDVINQNRVKEVVDKSLGMVRGEIVCARWTDIWDIYDDGPESYWIEILHEFGSDVISGIKINSG
jgi:peptide methionine sulfoxide reductase MsrB